MRRVTAKLHNALLAERLKLGWAISVLEVYCPEEIASTLIKHTWTS